MKKSVLFLIGTIVLLVSSCRDIANNSINDRVEELNKKCPISLEFFDEITKVEYRDGVISFYVTYDETKFNNSKLRNLIQNDRKFRKACVSFCLSNNIVKEVLLDHVTETMAKEVNLSFRVILIGLNSNEEFEVDAIWEELRSMNYQY